MLNNPKNSISHKAIDVIIKKQGKLPIFCLDEGYAQTASLLPF
jgi:hypothetical protein